MGWKDRVEGLERKGWGALSRKCGGLESGRIGFGRVEVEKRKEMEWQSETSRDKARRGEADKLKGIKS